MSDVAAFNEEAGVEATHGLIMVEFRVMVQIDEAPKKIGSVILPDEYSDRKQFSSIEGTLVAVSPLAFSYERWPEDARQPQIGDRVIFPKYTGLDYEAKDGKKYKIIEDKEIYAIKG